MPPTVPDEILALARERSDARAARDYATADRLRGEIEAAGWTVVDQGVDFRLAPARPPDVADGPRVRYGASTSVPSRLSEPPTTTATVVLVATDWPDDLTRTLASLHAHVPTGVQIVVVADAPSRGQSTALGELGNSPGGPDETVWTSARLGQAAALNAGIRRATGEVVVLVDTSVEATGDLVTPLVTALDDQSVAVAGGWGLVTDDLRHFAEAVPGVVAAIEGYCLAFRRADHALRGPLDEHFRFYRNLDIWWSLVLRDEGEMQAPRRAVAVTLPALRHEHRGWTSVPEAERDRLSKRNFYRVIDRFGTRRDLIVSAPRS